MTSSTPPEGYGADDETFPVAPPLAPEPGAPRRIDRWAAPRPDARPYRGSFIGMSGLAMMLFIILASGAVLPWYAVAGLTLVWIAALMQGARWFIASPGKLLLLPVLMLLLWLGTLMLGVLLLDWGQ